MALKVDYTFSHNGLKWRSGHFYSFRYAAWANDPIPLIILFYRITGINPNTGHQWRLIQGVNLNYIPRSHRRLFVNQWMFAYEQSNGDIKFTYNDMKRRYPWLRYGIRRYLTKPNRYIQNPVEIPFDNVEEAVISTYNKDFSRKLKQDLVDKYRRVKDRVEKHNKKTNRGLFGGNIFRNIFNWRKRS